MKRSLFAVVLACAFLTIFGCAWFGTPVLDPIGAMLDVDDQGHFKDDIVYLQYSTTITYFSDGRFERKDSRYEGATDDFDGDSTLGEGWVITSGNGGTYVYDTDLVQMTTSITSGVVQGEFAPLAEAETWVTTDNTCFGEYGYGRAYVKDPKNANTWIGAQKSVYSDRETRYATLLVIDPDAETYLTLDISESSNETGITSGSQSEYSGTFTLLPDGAQFRRGDAFTMRMLSTLYRYRNWSGAEYSEWTEDTREGIQERTFAHMGEFLVSGGRGERNRMARQPVSLPAEYARAILPRQ